MSVMIITSLAEQLSNYRIYSLIPMATTLITLLNIISLSNQSKRIYERLPGKRGRLSKDYHAREAGKDCHVGSATVILVSYLIYTSAVSMH